MLYQDFLLEVRILFVLPANLLIEIPLNTETLPNYDYSVVTSPTSSSNQSSPNSPTVWPQTQINNLLSITQSDSVEINIPNIPVNNSDNDNYPTNHDDIVLSDIDSDDDLSDFTTNPTPTNPTNHINPFQPHAELPRTPPTRRQYYNSFQLFPRNNSRHK